jgi:hypothetical protein
LMWRINWSKISISPYTPQQYQGRKIKCQFDEARHSFQNNTKRN